MEFIPQAAGPAFDLVRCKQLNSGSLQITDACDPRGLRLLHSVSGSAV
jgi:hypothetical protein